MALEGTPEENNICDAVISIIDSSTSPLEFGGRIIRALRVQLCGDFIKIGAAPQNLQDIANHIKTYRLGLPGLCDMAHHLGTASIPDIVRLFEAYEIYDFSDVEELALQSTLTRNPDVKFIKSLIPDFKASIHSLLPHFILHDSDNRFNRSFFQNAKALNKRLKIFNGIEEMETATLLDFHTRLVNYKMAGNNWENRLEHTTSNFKSNFDRIFMEFGLEPILSTES